VHGILFEAFLSPVAPSLDVGTSSEMQVYDPIILAGLSSGDLK
jgi:hypothetical protein